MKDKIKNLGELVEIVGVLKKEGKKIVFTNGCFDLLHIGHVRCFQDSKKLGDVLIVAINSDRSVRSIKGPTRPVIPQDERAEIMSALKSVDYVIIFDQHDPLQIITSTRPDILVKGGDWDLDTIIGRDVVVSYGGKVFALPLVPGVSTTQIINNMCEKTSTY